MYASDDGRSLLVATADDRLITLDADSAEQVGSIDLAGVAAFAPGGTGSVLATLPGSVEDPAAAAAHLSDLLGGDAATYERRLSATEGGTIVAGIGGADQRANIDAAIADGTLAGLTVQDAPRVAIATAEGVTFVAAPTGDVVTSIELDGGAFGLAYVPIDDAKLYVTTGGTDQGAPGEVATIAVAGEIAKNGPIRQVTMPLPGRGSTVLYDDASQMVHVLGIQPDGDGSTIYVIEPHANAVFADAPLPFDPVATVIDTAQTYPTDDRQQILAFEAGGQVASVEIGKHAFAWRVPGVLAGAAMAGLLYLLARILFRRREVAILVGIFTLVDGMLFVQSRIGMNDAYVGLGIVAAYTLFAAVWTGDWKWRGAFWVAMPLIGVCLGLALASKWVALYAIGGIGLLVFARSALGRLLIILGLIVVTGVLGHLALVVPEGAGLGNLPFVVIMIALTGAAVVINVLHPIAWSDDETRLAIGGAGRPRRARRARRRRHEDGRDATLRRWAGGDAAPRRGRSDPAVDRHLRRVRGGRSGRLRSVRGAARRDGPGRAAAAALAAAPRGLAPAGGDARGRRSCGWSLCLLVLPVAIYVASYIPWALIDAHRITDTWPRRPPGPDAHRPDPLDVRLPQQPDGRPRGVVAVVGLAARPEAGLVLPGGPGRWDDRGDLRRRQPRRLVVRDPGARLRRVAGVHPAQPGPRPDHHRVRVPVGVVGPRSTGPRSSTTTTRACRS